jgi:hypothetical protein
MKLICLLLLTEIKFYLSTSTKANIKIKLSSSVKYQTVIYDYLIYNKENKDVKFSQNEKEEKSFAPKFSKPVVQRLYSISESVSPEATSTVPSTTINPTNGIKYILEYSNDHILIHEDKDKEFIQQLLPDLDPIDLTRMDHVIRSKEDCRSIVFTPTSLYFDHSILFLTDHEQLKAIDYGSVNYYIAKELQLLIVTTNNHSSLNCIFELTSGVNVEELFKYIKVASAKENNERFGLAQDYVKQHGKSAPQGKSVKQKRRKILPSFDDITNAFTGKGGSQDTKIASTRPARSFSITMPSFAAGKTKGEAI